MRKDIHPKYHDVIVKCGCGNTFVTRSTYSDNEIRVGICNMCHPFYTGKEKEFEKDGTVEKFKKKYSWDAISKHLKEKLDQEEQERSKRRNAQRSSWYW